ncbi:hypothetical protein [Borrelia crocidurae]|nr:hypothetical protein [Borrelia crocidurae]
MVYIYIMKMLVNVVSITFLFLFLFVACSFERNLREFNSVIWDKALQFEQKALDKIGIAIGYIEGEHKNWDGVERALQDAIQLEEQALITLRDINRKFKESLGSYPSYTRYIYSYEDCKKLQSKLEMELNFKSKNISKFYGNTDFSNLDFVGGEQKHKNKLDQNLQGALKFLKGCRERMGVDIILRGFMKNSTSFYNFTFSKNYVEHENEKMRK